jgi:hypothetical protein
MMDHGVGQADVGFVPWSHEDHDGLHELVQATYLEIKAHETARCSTGCASPRSVNTDGRLPASCWRCPAGAFPEALPEYHQEQPQGTPSAGDSIWG